MNYLALAVYLAVIILDILIISYLISSSVKHFNAKKYFFFGVDIACAAISLALLMRAVIIR